MAEQDRRGGKRETVGRILGAARKAIGRSGFSGATLGAVAKEAGVSKGLLHYHFESKDHLLVETQRAFFRQLHERFTERASRGEGGLPSALDALDAMWDSVRELHGGAPFVVETLALSSHDSPLGHKVSAFYDESTALLEDAIRLVFSEELDALAVPPERMAVLIRVLLEGLVVELARARDEEALARVDAAYQDFRALFERFVLAGKEGPTVDLAALGPVPLPW
jgi:AcrR family transcriptional regulator